MIKKILVPYDNGTKAAKVLEYALDVARGNQAELCLLSSIKVPDYISTLISSEMIIDLEKQTRQKFSDILHEYEAKVAQEGVTVSSVVLDERPGDAIVRYAEEGQFDLIVMGSINRGSRKRQPEGLGSVSSYVLHTSNVPVLII